MKSKLYTATGDKGTTSLVGGERVAKTCLRLDTYGTLDEFSAFLGVALSHKECPEELKGQMIEIQNRLFDIGCHLATAPSGDQAPTSIYGLCEDDCHRLEGWIDALDEQTPKVNAFVLPGGCEEAAHLHVARTVCRRAERMLCRLNDEEPICQLVLIYFNRLSDYLFIAARFANFMAGVKELTWQPAKK